MSIPPARTMPLAMPWTRVTSARTGVRARAVSSASVSSGAAERTMTWSSDSSIQEPLGIGISARTLVAAPGALETRSVTEDAPTRSGGREAPNPGTCLLRRHVVRDDHDEPRARR